MGLMMVYKTENSSPSKNKIKPIMLRLTVKLSLLIAIISLKSIT